MSSSVVDSILGLGRDPRGADVVAPLYVGGEWRPAMDGGELETVEPATGRVLAKIAAGTGADLDLAVERALAAKDAWAAIPPAGRGELILQLAQRLEDRCDEFALLDARDNGSPYSEMRNDVIKGVKAMRRSAGLASELKGQTIPATTGRLHYTTLEPWGVVARIIAFNHPTLFAAARLSAALVAGNAVVLKPSELASLSTVALAGLADGIIPEGVLSVLTGGPELGAAIAGHREIRRISFTGSPATALKVQAAAASSGVIKGLSFELGGKNPIIIFPDADIEQAAAAAVRGMNFTRVQGQSCGSTSRLFVHRDVRDAVVDRILEQIAKVKIGDPTDPDVEMGSMISNAAVERAIGLVQVAIEDGARLLAGGGRPDDPALAGGAFMLPTVLDNVDHSSMLAQTEVFGPVLSVFEWDDVETCISQANDVDYGLTASVWSQDIDRALQTAHRLEAGFVWVNDVELRYGGVPFGGWKNSGVGLEDGLDELLSFTHARVVNVNYAARG